MKRRRVAFVPNVANGSPIACPRKIAAGFRVKQTMVRQVATTIPTGLICVQKGQQLSPMMDFQILAEHGDCGVGLFTRAGVLHNNENEVPVLCRSQIRDWRRAEKR